MSRNGTTTGGVCDTGCTVNGDCRPMEDCKEAAVVAIPIVGAVFAVVIILTLVKQLRQRGYLQFLDPCFIQKDVSKTSARRATQNPLSNVAKNGTGGREAQPRHAPSPISIVPDPYRAYVLPPSPKVGANYFGLPPGTFAPPVTTIYAPHGAGVRGAQV